MEYSHNFGSNFPGSLIEAGTKKDVDDTVKELIRKYYACMDAGDINGAYILYNANKEILEAYRIDMNDINRLQEEIYNVSLSVLKGSPSIIGTAEPADQSRDSFWYQDY
ncbi:MAG: hypothetical protein K2O06_18405 [Acetatifactor sp.]|nr:hypothetical protein [Acetatifactor sp.]